MQTIEGYVIHSKVNGSRHSWRSAPIIAASVVAALGFGVSLAAWSRVDAVRHAKIELRATPLLSAGPQPEADLAAFQQAIALSHLAHIDPLKPAARATPAAAPAREPAARLPLVSAKRSTPSVGTPPVPPARTVAFAQTELPPGPVVEAPVDNGFPIIGGLVRQVGALPTQARGLANGAGDRFFSAVSFVREKAGF